VYRAKDGRYLAVAALEPKFYIALGQALGRPANVAEIIGDAATHARVRAELAQIFATKTAAEWQELLAAHDCCVEVIVEPDELPAHPLHRARGVFFEIDGGDGVGPVHQVRTPVGQPAHPTPPPRLGQHSKDVLRDYGFDDAEISALVS
jgi:crotonobetainyl-CoA:carnitine CoA-transferase CaiB-like acyl-CoA transferase